MKKYILYLAGLTLATIFYAFVVRGYDSYHNGRWYNHQAECKYKSEALKLLEIAKSKKWNDTILQTKLDSLDRIYNSRHGVYIGL